MPVTRRRREVSRNEMMERRNILGRSDIAARVVAWVQQQRYPASAVPREIADARVAGRILTRLAIRGLVRYVEGGWIPSLILANAVEVQAVEAPV
jgi:hypothetical protein